MEDIFHLCREGNALQVRLWLDDTEHDMNQGDDHGFSPLHWAAKEGHLKVVEMLVGRGVRVGATNMGDDTALHLAVAHGHRDSALLLLRNKADPNWINEHGNTPLHYAAFWGYQQLAEDLVESGASVSVANKYGETPLDKCKGTLAQRLHDLAVEHGQDLRKIGFKDQSWLGLKTRSRDATLSRHKGIALRDLHLQSRVGISPTGETWRGRWQGNEVAAKALRLRECSARISRDFQEEFPRLRIFSHVNVLGVVGCVNSPPDLLVVSQWMPLGSLHGLLHQGNSGLVVDTAQALRFAQQIARGMAFLHSLERNMPIFTLNSRHVMVEEDLTARINMADATFSFQNKGKVWHPQWLAPEALQKKPSDINTKAADMWSFAILLWEMATRDLPFAELSAMEAGMKVALEGLRVTIPPGLSPHLTKLVRICMNEDPGRRPSFDMLMPILDKMQR